MTPARVAQDTYRGNLLWLLVIILNVWMRKVGGREDAPSTGSALPPLMPLLVAEDKTPVSTVRAVRVGHSQLRWGTQLLPALGNLHRRVQGYFFI